MGSDEMNTSVSAPVRGRLALAGDMVIATLDRRAHPHLAGQSQAAGIGAFARGALQSRWEAWNLPALAAVGGDTIYAYSRAGVVVALDLNGHERWRTAVPDDRSPQSQAWADRDGPFQADVVAAGDSVYLAAGAEVLRLAAGNGQVLGRATTCRSARGTIARLAAAAGGERLVATCTERTEWDDLPPGAGGVVWQPAPPLVTRRTMPGDLVAFDLGLNEVWRLPPVSAEAVYGDERPVALEDGGVACVAARAVKSDGGIRLLDIFTSWLLAVDGRNGTLRWQRENRSGHSQPDPLAVPGGVVAGTAPVFYALADGRPQWEVHVDRQGLVAGVTPVLDVDRERLLAAGRTGIRAIGLRDGQVSDVAAYGPSPFSGSITTPLLKDGDTLYLGVEEAGAARLLAIRLSQAA
jgi:outer membrane protein assembly factor BamB